MQPHQQQCLGVNETGQGVAAQLLGEQGTVREGELQMPGDKYRVQRFTVGRGAATDDCYRLHARHIQPRQLTQHVVLVAGHVFGGFLDGNDRTVQMRKANHVT